ncbi:PKD domain-containing protein [Pseudoprevotella muciniphila]|uniref:PKD domain-containing protein n=1 Tax=Pseudoprevotella muciniphila TaxID=2133944 RepID=A0A5P8E643_9BACT|nr:LamG-like jellyroll fold domain-containing protein [Pseudoprevotella muciniphila]QFQ12475.1 PKD domain-containing protein [Pseudoprevotella muciniphila]
MKQKLLLFYLLLLGTGLTGSAQVIPPDLEGLISDTALIREILPSWNPDWTLMSNVKSIQEDTTTTKGIKRAPKLNSIVTASDLPDHWNNAETMYFPPVIFQNGGSCGVSSRVGYMMNEEMNAYNGTDASLAKNRLAHNFQFPFSYGNYGIGKERMAMYVGYPSSDVWGGTTSSSIYGDHGSESRNDDGWMQGYDSWYNAMQHRITGTGSIPTGALTASGQEAMKRWLYNHNGDTSFKTGGMLGIGCGAATSRSWTIGSCEHNDALGFSSKNGLAWGSYVDHACTICGYDDRVWFDLDKNGVHGEENNSLGQNERGAWIVINTWGNWWLDGGFAYQPYALATPTTNAQKIIHPGATDSVTVYTAVGEGYAPEVYYYRKDYTPQQTLKATMTFVQRQQMGLTVGIAQDTTATSPEKTTKLYHFYYNGDRYNSKAMIPMLGRWSDGKLHYEPMEFGYDLTDLAADFDRTKPLKYFLTVETSDSCTGYGGIHAASIIDYESNKNGIETKFKIVGDSVAINGARQRRTITVVVWNEPIAAPCNLVVSGNNITWDAPISTRRTPASYKIYRDDALIDSTTTRTYNCGGTNGLYTVKAVYEINGNSITSPASNKLIVRPSSDLAKDNYTYTFSNKGFKINDVFTSMNQATIEWWVKPSSLTNWNQQIGPGWGTFLIHTTSSGELVYGWSASGNNNRGSISNAFSNNTWKHIAVVVDGNTMTAYVNGVKKGSFTSSSYNGIPSMNPFEFGSHYSGSSALYGVYDEVRVWKTARTATEIANNYKMPLIDDASYDDLLAYYRMDTFTQNGTTYLRDCVGGHHAPLVGNGSASSSSGNSHFTNYSATATINAPATALVGEPITLTYSSTADVVSRTWSCDGKTSTSASWDITFGSTGTKTVTLTVRTLAGNTKSTTASIVVNAAPAATAAFEQSAQEVTGMKHISFVSLNKTPNCTYSWSMPGADVETMDTRNATASYSSAGTFNVTLTVTDANGNSTSSTKQVVVNASAPVISFDQSATVIYKGESVTFTDNSLYNPTSYRWLLQCGNDIYSQSGKSVTFTPQRAGTYSVILTATNEAGSTTKTINKALIVCNAKSETGLRMSNDAITTNITNPEMTDGAWTIDFWYNPSELTSNCNSIATSNGLLDFHVLGNGDAELFVDQMKVGTWSDIFIANEWHHYALATSNNGTTSTYVLFRDGVNVGSKTQDAVKDWDTAMRTLIVGGNNGKFNGYMDEFRVWNKRLYVDEIRAVCVEPISTSTTGLKAYYNFNSIETGKVSDSTANHYDGSRTYSGPSGDVYLPSQGVFALDFSPEVGFQAEGTLLDQTLLTLEAYSDEEVSRENRSASNIIDNNTNTFWHSQWYDATAGYPHFFQFSREQMDTIESIKLYTYRDGDIYYPNTMNVEVSDDNETWTTLESGIYFPNRSTVGVILDQPITQKYFRLTFTSGSNGAFMMLNELYLYGKVGPKFTPGQKIITYVVKDTNGNEITRYQEGADENATLTVPDALKRDFCTYSEIDDIADEDKTVEVTCTYNYPFQISTSRSNAHYYYMKVRGENYTNANGTTNVQFSDKNVGNGLWAFMGNPYTGFQLINAINTDLTLYAGDDPWCNSNTTTYPYLSENNATTWTISKYDNNTFCLNIKTGTQTLFLNKFGNGSKLGYWTSGTGDIGSRITVEDYGNIEYLTLDPSKLYYIHNSYSGWGNRTYLYANNGVVSPGTKVAENRNYLWRLVYDPDSTKVQVVNVGTNQKIYIDNNAADQNLKLGNNEYKWLFIEGDGGVMINTTDRSYSWYSNPGAWANNIVTKDHWGYGWVFDPVDNYADTVSTNLAGYFTIPTNGYVGTLSYADSLTLRAIYNEYAVACTPAQYANLAANIDDATIKIESGKPYRLLNANYNNHWMALNMANNGNSTGSIINTTDPTANLSTILIFTSNGDDTWTVTMDGLYLTAVQQMSGKNQGTIETLSASSANAAPIVVKAYSPTVYTLCTQTNVDDKGYLHDNNYSQVVGWNKGAGASHWYIVPAENIKIGMNVVNGASYGTLYVPFSVTLNQEDVENHLVNFYKVTQLNTSNIVARRIDNNVIPAATPVILRDVNASTTLTLGVGGEGSPLSDNCLLGTYVNKTITDASNTYVLTSVDGGKTLTFGNCSTAYIPANKAYYLYTGTGTPKFGFDEGDGNITWIDGLTLDGNDNDAIYDLQGRKVNSKRATGGIYIVNGKKVLVK